MWMHDWPMPWQGGWSGPLKSLVCLDLLAGMFFASTVRPQIHTQLTLGLMKLIRHQVIKTIKYGKVPRKLIKKKEKKKLKN